MSNPRVNIVTKNRTKLKMCNNLSTNGSPQNVIHKTDESSDKAVWVSVCLPQLFSSSSWRKHLKFKMIPFELNCSLLVFQYYESKQEIYASNHNNESKDTTVFGMSTPASFSGIVVCATFSHNTGWSFMAKNNHNLFGQNWKNDYLKHHEILAQSHKY